MLKSLIAVSPAVIGIAISFSEPQNPVIDGELGSILKSFPNIVLIPEYKVQKVNGKILEIPIKPLFPDLKYGHTLIDSVESSIVYSFPLYRYYPAFSLEILNLYFKHKNINAESSVIKLKELLPKSLDIGKYSINEHILIDYQRPPEKFIQYSFSDILENKIDKEVFRNKIVLIGLTDRYSATLFATPFTGSKGISSPAVVLQAQIIDSFLNYRGLSKADEWLVYLVSTLLVVLFHFLIKNKTIPIQGLLFCIMLVLIGISDFLLFKYYAFWFPVALPFILILSMFGLSIYFTISNIDTEIITTFNKIQSSKDLPLINLPADIDTRIQTLTSLLDVINNDRTLIKAIIDGVNNGIFVLDENGKIIWANGRLMNIFKESLVLNQNINKLIAELEFNNICETIKNEQIFEKEIAINNLCFICVISAIATTTAHFVAVFNEITELKRLDRLKSDMVRMVSHEVKNPLAAIRLNAEGIYFINNKEKLYEKVDNIISTTDLLIEITNNFLNIGRLEANIVVMNFSESDLVDLINKSIALQEAIAKNKNIKINFQYPNQLFVSMDKQYIFIALNNILSNAIKYSHESSEIIIELQSNPEFVKISVKDSGIGIPQEDLSKIFDKFYRSTNNIENNIEGTGLGLSIVQKIIANHKGEVGVNSEYGKGSCFWFTLPVVSKTT